MGISRILKSMSHILPDRVYIPLKYYQRMHKRLHLRNPKTYNEKIQWLKLYYRDPLYVKLVDKYAVKDYIARKIGEEYIIPTLGVWDSFDEIDFSKLPDQFVLKTTHDSGGIVICKNKAELDLSAARKKLERSLRNNYYWHTREWQYREVKPRIIAEKYMVDESGYELKDYKFFCFDGTVRALFIATDRGVAGKDTKFDFFDQDFHHLPIRNGHDNADRSFQCPDGFEQMKQLAAKLSKGMPQVRVDLYNINGQIYFGEMTFSHFAGMTPFEPEKWDYVFGDWIQLPEKMKK